MWLVFLNWQPFQLDFQTQMSPISVRHHPGIALLPPGTAFSFPGIRTHPNQLVRLLLWRHPHGGRCVGEWTLWLALALCPVRR